VARSGRSKQPFCFEIMEKEPFSFAGRAIGFYADNPYGMGCPVTLPAIPLLQLMAISQARDPHTVPQPPVASVIAPRSLGRCAIEIAVRGQYGSTKATA